MGLQTMHNIGKISSSPSIIVMSIMRPAMILLKSAGLASYSPSFALQIAVVLAG